MILKYFHYHVGSCVSKNTRGGDTIRLLIKLIVMIEYCASGEDVLGNTICILRNWGSIWTESRRQFLRIQMVFPNTSSPDAQYSIILDQCGIALVNQSMPVVDKQGGLSKKL